MISHVLRVCNKPHPHNDQALSILPSESILFSSISLLIRPLAFSMVQTATSRAEKRPAGDMLPM